MRSARAILAAREEQRLVFAPRGHDARGFLARHTCTRSTTLALHVLRQFREVRIALVSERARHAASAACSFVGRTTRRQHVVVSTPSRAVPLSRSCRRRRSVRPFLDTQVPSRRASPRRVPEQPTHVTGTPSSPARAARMFGSSPPSRTYARALRPLSCARRGLVMTLTSSSSRCCDACGRAARSGSRSRQACSLQET